MDTRMPVIIEKHGTGARQNSGHDAVFSGQTAMDFIVLCLICISLAATSIAMDLSGNAVLGWIQYPIAVLSGFCGIDAIFGLVRSTLWAYLD